jgi:hypothetical protein
VTEVADVDIEEDRDRAKLAVVDTVLFDWLEKRACLFARFSNDAFLVCEGARLGMIGGSSLLLLGLGFRGVGVK